MTAQGNPRASTERTTDELIVRRPAGAILSVRMPREQLIAVDELASSQGMTVSELVREAIDSYFRVPRVAVSMPMHGTSSAVLRLAGPNIEFVSVPSRTRTQTFEKANVSNQPQQLPLLTA